MLNFLTFFLFRRRMSFLLIPHLLADYRRRDPGMVQRIPQGLPERTPERGRIQEDLRQFLSLRRRVQGTSSDDCHHCH